MLSRFETARNYAHSFTSTSAPTEAGGAPFLPCPTALLPMAPYRAVYQAIYAEAYRRAVQQVEEARWHRLAAARLLVGSYKNASFAIARCRTNCK